jgi:hypothetical protein
LKIALILVAVSLFSIDAEAQAPPASWGMEIGVTAGRLRPLASGQSGSTKPGILAALYARSGSVTRTINIQVGIGVEQKRSRISVGGESAEYSLTYLEVPVLARLLLFKGFYMLEGASLEIPLAAKVGGADVKEDVTSPEVGLVMSAGYPFRKFALEFRYDGGFRRVDKRAGAIIQRNRSFALLTRIPLE